MIPAGHHIWRLSKSGEQSLGLSCTEDGLYLAGTPLVERRDGMYVVRKQSDLQPLLDRVYGTDAAVPRVMPGLATVAAALSQQNLPPAQIAALHLRLPDLPDAITRAGLEAEDLLIKREHSEGRLARSSWDEAAHPRTGTSPNPGWFAPKPDTGVRTRPVQTAQRGRGERESEEAVDPLAPLRQALWDSRIALLR